MIRYIKNILDVLNVLGKSSIQIIPIIIEDWVEPSTFSLVANSTWDINGIGNFPAGAHNNINVDTSTYGQSYTLNGDIRSISFDSGECDLVNIGNTIETLIFDTGFIAPKIDLRNANNLHSMVDYPSVNDIHILYVNAGDNPDARDAAITLLSVAAFPGIVHIPTDAYYYSELTTQATNYGWIISNN